MSETSQYPMRINKHLAQKGIASRREADALIERGQVLVNGERAVVGQQVHETDDVTITGKTPQKRYFAYYKGRGVITHSPAPGETDIMTQLKSSRQDLELGKIAPIGRLDKDSEGLLLLSDDGRLTSPLLDPDSDIEKEYEVLLDKPANNWFVKHMQAGVSIEGYTTKPAQVSLSENNKKRALVTLTEGKKHQIRRMCAALGYQVQSLKRVRIANIELGSLKPNQHRKLTKIELNELFSGLDIGRAG